MKHHVLDHWGQFHGNFKSYEAAAEWVERHEDVEIGLIIREGEFVK